MTAATLPTIRLEQNADYIRTISILDTTPEQTPIDLTGCTIVAKARSKPSATQVLFSFTITPIDLSIGKFKLSAPHTTTRYLINKTAVWDMLITWTNGQIDRVLEGDIEFDRGIS